MVLNKRAKINWKIILSLIWLLVSAVTAVVDYIVDNNANDCNIIFAVSVIFFVLGRKKK